MANRLVMSPPGELIVEVDVLVGVLALKVDELGHDEVADLVVDGRSQEHDAVLQQPRVDVERPLAAVRLLDDDRNEIVLRITHRMDPLTL